MSIPIDRLYHFLYDLVNHNVIIYRWLPHGSKNITDLVGLHEQILSEVLTTPIMICHDQEPLDYHYYGFDAIKDYADLHSPRLKLQITHPDAKKLFKSALHSVALENIYDLRLLTHSELNSPQAKIYEDNGFVLVYFWSHALIARDWYRYAEIDPALKHNDIKYDFLVYNRAWSGVREYRLKFAELIVSNQMSKNCLMGFNPYDADYHYTNHKFKNNAFSITSNTLEKNFFLNTHDADASADYVNSDYTQCGIEVVLETLFDDVRLHLTEKTLRPIACGKPFMLAATPNSLAYLRSYGFETFGNIVDESYDSIDDHCERLNALVSEMKRISNLSSTEKSLVFSQLNEIASRNKKYFFSTEFRDSLIHEYQSNFLNGYNKVQNSCNGTNFYAVREFMLKNFPNHVCSDDNLNLIRERLSCVLHRPNGHQAGPE